MAWGICFVSLSAIQVSLPDLQELFILWPDMGNIRGYPVLPKSRRALEGGELNFNSSLFLPWPPKEQQGSARWELAFSEAHSKRTPLFSRATPPHSAELSQPCQGCPTLQNPSCCPRHWPCPPHLFQHLPHQIYQSLWVSTLFWPCL